MSSGWIQLLSAPLSIQQITLFFCAVDIEPFVGILPSTMVLLIAALSPDIPEYPEYFE